MASFANRFSRAHDEVEANFTMMQAFEWYTPGGGNHWNWLADNAERFADMGITALWIPPPTKAAGQDSTGYDIYDLWDLGEFAKDPSNADAIRTKYGNRQELEAAMKKLNEHSIAIYIDAVLNHKLGADGTETFKVQQVDENERSKKIGEPRDIEGWTKFNFEGRNGKYSQMQWNFEKFTGVDYDNKTGDKGVFRILGDNKGFANDVDPEKGGYDYLMGADVDHDHPEVSEDMINWGKWLVRTFPIAGFRFDAVKHISRHWLAHFVSEVRKEASKVRKEAGVKLAPGSDEGPALFGVGEYWKDDVDTCLRYLSDFGEQQFSLFDAPLHYNFAEASNAGKDYDLRKIFDGTIVAQRPIDACTLVENHDTQEGQSLASPVNPTFKPLAYSIILLRQDGYPCIFLGDLDGVHKQDENGQPTDETTQSISNLDKIIKARKYFAFGEQRDYWDHPSCVGWVRAGTEKHDGCAVVLCVGDGEGVKRMEVGKDKAGQVYVDALGWQPDAEVTIGDDGWADFKSPAHSVGIWVRKDAQELKHFQ
ncbi:unnamed protein product [Sympodiomycopsis kandeliae]